MLENTSLKNLFETWECLTPDHQLLALNILNESFTKSISWSECTIQLLLKCFPELTYIPVIKDVGLIKHHNHAFAVNIGQPCGCETLDLFLIEPHFRFEILCVCLKNEPSMPDNMISGRYVSEQDILRLLYELNRKCFQSDIKKLTFSYEFPLNFSVKKHFPDIKIQHPIFYKKYFKNHKPTNLIKIIKT